MHTWKQKKMTKRHMLLPHMCTFQVYAGIFPMDQSEHSSLRNALDKLTLNDPSVRLSVDSRLGKVVLLYILTSISNTCTVILYGNSLIKEKKKTTFLNKANSKKQIT